MLAMFTEGAMLGISAFEQLGSWPYFALRLDTPLVRDESGRMKVALQVCGTKGLSLRVSLSPHQVVWPDCAYVVQESLGLFPRERMAQNWLEKELDFQSIILMARNQLRAIVDLYAVRLLEYEAYANTKFPNI